MLPSSELRVYLAKVILSIVSDRPLGVPFEQTIDSHLRSMSRKCWSVTKFLILWQLDRAVKIWALPPTIESPQISRQDKPLFNTAGIHRGRVLSINW